MSALLKSAPAFSAHPAVNGATFGILTGENPRFPSGWDANNLPKLLEFHGLTFETVKGKYEGVEEASYIVYDIKLPHLVALGEMFGQESVIYSSNGKHRLIYTNGPNVYKYHPGGGVEIHQTAPGDFYSTVQTDTGPLHFTLSLNFDELYSLYPDVRKAA